MTAPVRLGLDAAQMTERQLEGEVYTDQQLHERYEENLDELERREEAEIERQVVAMENLRGDV